ncbi:hypothetical protein JFU18_27990 [Bacillus sp. TH22]|uniref:3-oxoacyl-[acyl-carrier-protein] synthase III C-terminal domain-containing protein n=1 Tax=unclassified Bacillus (in: firmicutes) TaxID=185979 RepID=UPI0019140106|nr:MULTISPECIES: 3-oxoacyl-[acyl-carrier-protein] synthase III C-terminal domain-containing protein [unclassified Bacillus (in: firmicutes)]MBK5345627.1 hypothetical protein [Bacillus sp. TH45]MBK5452307.1 hypothetical protein [Bacillus sp. TH22]
MRIGIQGIGIYVPNNRVNLKELASTLYLSENELDVLMNTHHLKEVAVETEKNANEMLIAAIENLMLHNKIDSTDVGLILFTHTILQFSPFLSEPLLAIKDQFGFHNAHSMSVANLNCAGMDFLLSLSHTWLLNNNHAKSVLILTSDKTFVKDFRYLKESSVMGDAACAVLVSKGSQQNQIIASNINVDATIFNGEASAPEEFDWFLKSVSTGIIKNLKSLLKDANFNSDDITLIIPSNINFPTWSNIGKILKIPIEKFYFPTLSNTGHAHNSDPILNLHHAIYSKKIHPGDYYVTLTAGIGGTFGCTLFKC